MNINEEQGHDCNSQVCAEEMKSPVTAVSDLSGRASALRDSGAELRQKMENERRHPVVNGLDLRARLAAASAGAREEAAYPSPEFMLSGEELATPGYETPPNGPEKEEECSCCGDGAAGSSSSGNNSVDFSLTFGRFPGIPGLKPGKLSLYSNLLQVDALENPGSLKFEHVTRRRCSAFNSDTGKVEDMKSLCLLTERNYARFTQFAGKNPEGESFSRSLSKPEKLRKRTVAAGELPGMPTWGGEFLQEVLEDSTELLYSQTTGKIVGIKPPHGFWVSAERLEEELKVTEYDLFISTNPDDKWSSDPSFRSGRQGKYIRQIWSRTDGLLDMDYNRMDPGVHSYTLRWYAPGTFGAYNEETRLYAIPADAQPLKEWVFSPRDWSAGGRLVSGPDTQEWPPEYPELRPGRWPLYDSLDSRPFDQRRKFWPYDLKYLKSFTITETRDGEQIQSLWEMPHSAAELIFRKGDVVIRKTRYANESPTEEEIRNGYAGPDRDFLEANNSYAKSVIETTYVNDLLTETAVHARYAFGDVCTYKSKGSGDACQSISYEYEFDQDSDSYGCLKEEYHSNGYYVRREYDNEKREICRLEPWAGGGEKVTRTTYKNELFNDRRIAEVAEYIRRNSEERQINRTTYDYSETSLERTEQTTRTALGFLGAEYPHNVLEETRITRWYGAPGTGLSSREAGRLKMTQAPDGTQEWYEYEDCSESYLNSLMVHRRVKTTRLDGELVPGQSEKIEYYYNELDELQMEKRYVLTEEGFVMVGWTGRRFDAAHRIVFEETGEGAYSETTWKCQGPAWQTRDNGQTIACEYDTAGRLVRKTESALQMNNDDMLDPSMMSFLNLPAVVTEYEYDALGHKSMEKVTMGDSVSVTRREWDALGRPVRETDAAGLVTTYTYSPDGLVTTMTAPTGATFITRRHQDGSLLSEEGTGQQDRFFSYETCPEGLITTVRLDGPSGPVIEDTLTDGLGRVRCVNTPAGDGNILYNVSWYDESGRVICAQSGNYIYQQSLAGVNLEYGVMGSAVRRSTLYAESTGRPDRIEESASRYVTRAMAPLADRRLVWRETTRAVYFGENDESPVLEKSYDLVSETTEVRDARVLIDRYGWENASWIKQMGEKTVTCQSIAGATGINSEVSMNGWLFYSKERGQNGIYTWYTFEADGFLETSRNSSGKCTTIRRDMAGRPVSLTRDIFGTRTRTYDPATGLLTAETDFTGTATRYAHDIRGREIARFGEGTQPLLFTYDEADRLTSMTTFRAAGETITGNPSGRSDGDRTQWIYDRLTGLALKKIMPDGSTTTGSYDAYGRPALITSARGLKKTFTWNGITGDLEKISYNDGTPAISFTYDDRGLVHSVTDGAGTRTWTYNERLDAEKEHFEGEYTYDLYFMRDQFGRPNREYLDINGKNYQKSDFYYDEVSGRWRGAGDYSKGSVSRLYDPVNGKVLEVDGRPHFKMLNEYDYSTDNLLKRRYLSPRDNHEIARLEKEAWHNGGMLTRRQDTFEGNALEQKEYQYNSRSELIGETRANGGRQTYTYDNIGNRLLETGAEDAYCRRYTYNRGLNQYDKYELLNEQGSVLRSQNIDWDLDGNQMTVPTETGVWQVVWNAENRPVCFRKDGRTVEYVYDYMGRRVSKITMGDDGYDAGYRYIYSGYRMIAELSAAFIQENRVQEPVCRTWVWDGNPVPGASVPLMMTVWERPTGPTPYPAETGYPETGYPETPPRDFIMPTLYPIFSLQTKYPFWALLESPYPPFEIIPPANTYYLETGAPTQMTCNTYTYLHDDNKNVMGMVDSDGRLIASYKYDAYGRCRKNGSGGTGSTFLWSSEYYDDTVGLIFYNYRCYNPLDGRWLSRDPIGEEGGANLYAFVGNDPLNSVDLLGLAESTYQTGEEAFSAAAVMVVEAMEEKYFHAYRADKDTAKMEENIVAICCSFKDNKKEFRITEIKSDRNGSVSIFNFPKCSKGESLMGYVHSHPLRDSGLSGSPTDPGGQGYGDRKLASDGVLGQKFAKKTRVMAAARQFNDDVIGANMFNPFERKHKFEKDATGANYKYEIDTGERPYPDPRRGRNPKAKKAVPEIDGIRTFKVTITRENSTESKKYEVKV